MMKNLPYLLIVALLWASVASLAGCSVEPQKEWSVESFPISGTAVLEHIDEKKASKYGYAIYTLYIPGADNVIRIESDTTSFSGKKPGDRINLIILDHYRTDNEAIHAESLDTAIKFKKTEETR